MRTYQQIIQAVILICGLPFLQVGNAAEKKGTVRATVEKHGWTPTGELVLAVRIYAKSSEPLVLGALTRGADGQMTGLPNPYTLGESSLVDSYSQTKISALPALPAEPYFGSMSLITAVAKGGWIQMSVAFPPLPVPPPSKDGKPQNYKFLLYLPLIPKPVAVTIPQPPKT